MIFLSNKKSFLKNIAKKNIFDFSRFFFSNSNISLRNITPTVEDKLNKKLYLKKNHPLNIIKSKIVEFFSEENSHKWSKLPNTIKDKKFSIFEDLPQIVSTKECFDNLLVDENNETRLPKNTYYIDNDNILRTHMTAFDIPLIKNGSTAFISIGDVFRRDAIDKTHYPIFHQIDGVRLFDSSELNFNPYSNINDPKEVLKEDLKFCLENLIK